MVGVIGLIKGPAAGSISLILEFHRLLPAKRRFCPNSSGFTVLTVTSAFTTILASSSWEQAGVALAMTRAPEKQQPTADAAGQSGLGAGEGSCTPS